MLTALAILAFIAMAVLAAILHELVSIEEEIKQGTRAIVEALQNLKQQDSNAFVDDYQEKEP